MATNVTHVTFSRLNQKIATYARQPVNCAQATLMALQACYRLETGPILRALSLYSCGTLSSESPCGAVTAGMLALGLVFGAEPPGNVKGVYDNMQLVRDYCRRITDELGGLSCRRIQKAAARHPEDVGTVRFGHGWRYRINEMRLCKNVMETSARTVGEIIVANQAAVPKRTPDSACAR